VKPLLAGVGSVPHRAAARARAVRRRRLDRGRIERYLDTHIVKKLQLGTGPNPLPGWLNTDLRPDSYLEHRETVVFLDAAKPFPFPSATFDYVFSEHLIEHITEPEARGTVAQCFRVLGPGGRVRIATPDLAAIVRLYAEPLGEIERQYIDWVMERFLPPRESGNRRCYVVNQMFHGHGHRFIYDEETLRGLLADAGFVEIERRGLGESLDPALRGVEGHGRAIGNEDANRLETMVIEGVRPPREG
jgi:predicted SAM-dependent methyltransferase